MYISISCWSYVWLRQEGNDVTLVKPSNHLDTTSFTGQHWFASLMNHWYRDLSSCCFKVQFLWNTILNSWMPIQYRWKWLWYFIITFFKDSAKTISLYGNLLTRDPWFKELWSRFKLLFKCGLTSCHVIQTLKVQLQTRTTKH